jgi:cation diffusion facilitator CzcD-associated flavoprotein CzcO
MTVGIVGAGPAGLAAAAALQREGIEYEVLERHEAIGGIWDIDNPGSPMYESAHFISSRTLSGFAGFPMGDSLPDYPTRVQVLDYVRSFAADSGIEGRVRVGAEVRRASPRSQGGWTVELAEGASREYDHLVCASGHQWEPRLPAYADGLDCEWMHSRDYRSPALFDGRRVLIVGAGNSGCDIACDAAPRAARTVLSLRRGYHFFPKHLFGQPSDVFAHGGPRLPLRLEQAMLTLALKLLVGDLTKYGLPKPDHKVLESHPIMNTQVLHYLGHGDLHARGDVTRAAGSTVRFADGSEEEFDLVVFATGYGTSMPYLPDDTFTWQGTRPDLFLTQFHRERDDISVMGLFEVDAGAYPILSLQAELLLRALRGGTEWRALKQTRPDLSGGTRHVDSERHDISIQDAAYQRYVRKLLAATA